MNSLACKAAASLVALLPVYGAMPVPAEDSPYFIKERIIPPEYKIAGEFLEYLKPVNGSVEFSANAAPKWDIARLLSFISPDGLAATDVNRGGKLVHYTPQQIRNSVTARKVIHSARFHMWVTSMRSPTSNIPNSSSKREATAVW